MAAGSLGGDAGPRQRRRGRLFPPCGRADDVIISAGWTIGATEVEDALLRHPAVREAAVIGIPDALRGQVVKAVIVSREPSNKAKMHEMPLSDFYHDNIPVQPNGQSLDTIHVWQVKPPAQARYKWDFYVPIATVPGKDAFMPLAETGCKLTET